MEENKCNNKNPLNLNGTAQDQRSPLTLDPQNIQLDAKTEADFHLFAQAYAKLVQYYSLDNFRDGDWENFFAPENFETNTTHIVLFNAFLKLLKFAQNDINQIATRHLEFYYEDVLRLSKKQAKPDQAHILFELANTIKTHLVEEKTILKAGKDALGKEKFFETDTEIAVNTIKTTDFKSVYVGKLVSNKIRSIHKADIANSSDGKGGDLNPENPKWLQFGESQIDKTAANKTMDYAELGFAISSPVLLMKEGVRTIKLKFTYTTEIIELNSLKAEDFKVFLSGEKEWLEAEIIDDCKDNEDKDEKKELSIVFSLSAEKDAIVNYNNEVFEEQFDTKAPVLKVYWNQSNTKGNYIDLSSNIGSVNIDVSVVGIKDLILHNENGKLDPAKPFLPFGASPTLDSGFYIGSQEIFSKPLYSVQFNINWLGLPNFSNHYAQYTSKPTSKNQFKVYISALKKGIWKTATSNNKKILEERIKLHDSIFRSNFNSLDEIETFTQFSNDMKSGFIRMELKEPMGSFKAFGHNQYQKLFVEKSIAFANGTTKNSEIPNEPYTPKIKSLTLDYKAFHNLSSDKKGSFFHIGPFGQTKIDISKPNGYSLLPKFNKQAYFYIGLEGINAPQNLSLLFQIAEGSANPEKNPEKIAWHYLTNTGWEKFKTEQILSDKTKGLITSGIIKFDLPKEMTDQNTWMPLDKYWIRASISENSDSVCQLINIHPQAVKASFADDENDLSHLANSLPAETISKLDEGESAVKKVIQPYASFGGQLPELEDNYYRRVSERLRHKNRAITIWDYEHLILEEFPSVYKVKCLNHTRMNALYAEQAPGNISVLILSNLRNKNAVNPLQPKTSLAKLTEINEFLSKINNPFIKLYVKNPVYEEVTVDFNVNFHKDFDKGLYEKKIKEDIKQFLSPWAYQDGIDISFEGVIYKSRIINFIEELPYVDYVSCFRMRHSFKGNTAPEKDLDEIKPSITAALLVSGNVHKVNEIKDCTC